jgi:hypothetical protein
VTPPGQAFVREVFSEGTPFFGIPGELWPNPGGPSTGPPLNSCPIKVNCESRVELSPHEAASAHPHALFQVRQSESNRS